MGTTLNITYLTTVTSNLTHPAAITSNATYPVTSEESTDDIRICVYGIPDKLRISSVELLPVQSEVLRRLDWL